jgi:hypothetical protein
MVSSARAAHAACRGALGVTALAKARAAVLNLSVDQSWLPMPNQVSDPTEPRQRAVDQGEAEVLVKFGLLALGVRSEGEAAGSSEARRARWA